MKKLLSNTILAIAAVAAFGSCDTLEQMPVDKLYEDNAFLTEDDLALYTNSFYTMFPSAYNVFYADRISDYIAPVAINKFFLGTYTAQDSGNWTELMVLQEEMKTMPFGEIWMEYCRICGAPADGEWFATVKKYEAEVLSKRG